MSRGKRIELLAPAGGREAMRAAVANGADAVYFGLQDFNARARAENFGDDAFRDVMRELHVAGVEGHLAFNTLLFGDEMRAARAALERAIAAGVDAVIVQDLAAIEMVRAIDARVPIHASTQMTVADAVGAAFVQRLGATRVILAREVSVAEIAVIRAETDVELEVFVHGALCVAYSGQCLTSEAWGGRSANRGACAQACRLPYDLVSDGEVVDLAGRSYLVSPKDLAAHDLVPALIEAGVTSLKIEGRLKSPEYVAAATRVYRTAIDEAQAGRAFALPLEAQRDLDQTFSRGFSHGFLDGVNHQALVDGRVNKKRGERLGRVVRSEAHVLIVERDGAAEIKAGDGVVVDLGDPFAGEPGGRVYGVRSVGLNEMRLEFARDGREFPALAAGLVVWKNSDPAVERRLRATFEGRATGPRQVVDLMVSGVVGEALRVVARVDGVAVEVVSDVACEAARGHALDEATVREKVARFDTLPVSVGSIDLRTADVALPVRELKRLARALRVALADKLSTRVHRLSAPASAPAPAPATAPALNVLCRTPAQIRAAHAGGALSVTLDFLDLVGLADAVRVTRSLDFALGLATPRIQKPGETRIVDHLVALKPDFILARSLGSLETLLRRDDRPRLIGDFSLNAVNPASASRLLSLGLDALTPGYDLDATRLKDFIDATDATRLEIVVHHRTPLFHMEHCVFAAFLSSGTDHTNCGRPCDRHVVRLRDRTGREHPLTADVGCRNTLFNAEPETAIGQIPRAIAVGVRRFRVELVDEDGAAATSIVREAVDVMSGLRPPTPPARRRLALATVNAAQSPIGV
ncbi:MAG: DUF3656 domain-containing protein [Deltaproteobacteria bacterium]|nr:DUF3656 domain-containing protein [Deltaproteobacteria bacterium]